MRNGLSKQGHRKHLKWQHIQGKMHPVARVHLRVISHASQPKPCHQRSKKAQSSSVTAHAQEWVLARPSARRCLTKPTEAVKDKPR